MAGSVIGALRVNLGLDSAQFERGAKRVKDPLRNMRRQFQAISAAAAAAGAAVSAMALKGGQEIDKSAKAARRLGSSVGGFRALELAADEAGVSLSTLTNDVQTIDREIASIGKSGNAQRALDELGLSIDDLAGKDADEKLATIADRVQELGLTTGETTSILRDLGVRNREMVLLVSQGGDALRQARRDIEEYGLALSQTDSAAIEQANDRMSRLGLISQYLRQRLAVELVPAMGEFAQAMTDSLREGGRLRAVIDGLVDNLGYVARAVVSLTSFFGVRFVGALVAAKVATISLSGALVFLRGAMIRTGIGALVVIAGELVYQFGRLVSASGGFGEAMTLLKNVAAEVWDRIKLQWSSAVSGMKANNAQLVADFLTSVQGMVEGVVSFGNTAANAFEGAFEAIKAIWGLLPAAIGDLVFQAANSLIDGVEAMLNSVTSRINGFIEGINSGLDALGVDRRISLIPDLELGDIENRFAGAADAAAGAAKDAFARAFEDDPLEVPDFGLVDAARNAGAAAVAHMRDALSALEDARAPLESIQALRDVMAQAADEMENGGVAANKLGNELDDVADSAGGAADKVKDVEDAGKEAGRSLAGVFSSAAKSAESLSDFLNRILSQLADMLIDSAFQSLFSGISGGGIIGALFGSAKGNVFRGGAPVTAFARGGVVSGPTTFPMRGGVGLMGEAGPEAIMPLARDSGGRLGVRAQGGGGAVEVVARVENGSIVQDVRRISGDVAVKAVREGLSAYDRMTLPGSVNRIRNDPTRRG